MGGWGWHPKSLGTTEKEEQLDVHQKFLLYYYNLFLWKDIKLYIHYKQAEVSMSKSKHSLMLLEKNIDGRTYRRVDRSTDKIFPLGVFSWENMSRQYDATLRCLLPFCL